MRVKPPFMLHTWTDEILNPAHPRIYWYLESYLMWTYETSQELGYVWKSTGRRAEQPRGSKA
jgi:hypothetical protein